MSPTPSTRPTPTTALRAGARADVLEPFAEHDRRLALGATGLLAELNRAGVLEAPDVHVARRVGVLGREDDERVLLAVALAVRAVRWGSVCVDPVALASSLAELAPDLPWPDPQAWRAAVLASPLVTEGVLRVEGGGDPSEALVLYLDRYHRLESQVCDDLVARVAAPSPEVDEARLEAALARVRGTGDHRASDQQERAVVTAVRRRTTVLTGGPGTGKTTTVARLLAVLADQADARGERLSIALAAPTGKAATRLQEAVVDGLALLDEADRERVGRPESMTLHRLLGWRPDNQTRFRHDRANRLKYDVVVVDECSMVDLTLMARLLEAVRAEARLVLVGDPRQLTSVGAGAVLADVVGGFADALAEGAGSPVASLTANFRSRPGIQAVADALRAGDADAVLAALRSGGDEVAFVELPDVAEGVATPASVLAGVADALRPDLLATAHGLRAAGVEGDHVAALALLEEHRLLCAHREGPYGVRHWNRQVERWLAEELGLPALGEWYVGRPLLVTANDYTLSVYNGETGVAVAQPDGRLRAWVAGSERVRDLAPGRLDAVETMHAMTIHKSQGSQARRVSVLLPEQGSRLLTRELFYTALTRAQDHVRVVASEGAVRAAVAREADRASGLRRRLAARVGTAEGG